jgi:phage protein D
MAIALPAIERQILIDGIALNPRLDAQLERVVVVDRLAMPDTFVLSFSDPDPELLKPARMEIGKRVSISSTPPKGDTLVPLITGEITSIEADYQPGTRRLVVRGYDLSHRLAAGRKTATFENAKLSDIATRIAEEAGLEAEVDDSVGEVPHVIQPNLSDLDFLYSLARRIGFDCRVEGDRLLFKRPTPSSDAPDDGDFDSTDSGRLVWEGDRLLEFRARMSAVAQVSEVKVRGWDVGTKQAVIGQADASASNATISMTPADLAKKVGGKTLVVVDRPVGAQEAADEVARTKAEEVGSAAFEATAVVVGDPALKAGVAVSISNVDPPLAGRWVISSSRHEFGNGPYRTYLEFSGRQDRSLHGVVTGGLANGGGRSVIPGVVIGIVTDNDDKDLQGRVKVHYPWLSEDAVSSWARLAMPGAGGHEGQGYGMAWVPQVGDEVLVAFVHGDLSQPVVIGGLWNGKDVAPLGEDLIDDGKVKRSGFVSREGHMVIFFDGDDSSGIALVSADHKLRVSLNQTAGVLHLHSDGDLLIEAGGAMELKAGGDLIVKGAKVALNPPG